MQKNYEIKQIKRLQEGLSELSSDARDKMVDHLLGMQEDEIGKRNQERAIVPISEFTKEARKIRDNWGTITGIRTGYPSIDSMTKGLDPGNLIILAGRTSQYKTMLSLNIAMNIALDGIPVLFVTLENTKAEIAGRLMKMCKDEDEYDKVSVLIGVQVEDELNWRSIDALIANFKELFLDGIVFIDHLHYFSRDTENTAETLGVVTKEFKKNAIRHELPIVLISHVRKALNDKENSQMPSINDIRGSSLPAQDADIVLMVGGGSNNNVIVEIEKNRNKGFDPENSTTYLKKVTDGIRIL